MSDTVDLAADGIAVSPTAVLDSHHGPPYPITFEVERGDRWPALSLVVGLGRSPLLAILTTEPRLKAALREVLDELD